MSRREGEAARPAGKGRGARGSGRTRPVAEAARRRPPSRPRARAAATALLGLVAACGPRVPAEAPTAATRPAIDAADLELRLRAFAHDSMGGRQAGTRGNHTGTAWLAREARRIGLEPAGEDGTYFQTVPLRRVRLDPESRIGPLTVEAGEVLPLPPPNFPFAADYDVRDAEVVYGGWGELDPADAAGKVVLMANPTGPGTSPAEWAVPYADAALILVVAQGIDPNLRAFLLEESAAVEGAQADVAPAALVTPEAARALFGSDLAAARPGQRGATRVSGRGGLLTRPVEAPARNVVAVLRGSDPALRDEYVVLGAHNDHVGPTDRVLDHDSIRAVNRVSRPEGLQTPPRPLSAEEAARVRALRDSLGADGPRPDSIHNGADDDGSGSVALLEIAERFAADPPRRSLLFVWHTGEELGMVGSRWFTDHPTVPIDAMVAQLNLDMIGRGMEGDLPGGGMDYLQLIGTRRLSTELGDLVEAVNRQEGHGFAFDYQYDAEGHPQNIYCRSDHAMYARFGVPVAFFTTGVHPDYHQATDEVEYISFPKLAAVTRLVADVAGAVADLGRRPVVDGPVPDPNTPCRQ